MKKLLSKTEQFLTHLYYNLKKVKVPSTTTCKGFPFIKVKGKIEIGENCVFNSRYSSNPIGGQTFITFNVLENASLIIGNAVGISNSTFFISNKMEIGDGAFIGGDCKFYDSDFHSLNPKYRKVHTHDPDIKTAPIRIAKNAFIGGGSIVLKGVSIGENSILGAGSVLTKSIPDNQIWGGNPAKFIRMLDL